jgi:hypothetical protein
VRSHQPNGERECERASGEREEGEIQGEEAKAMTDEMSELPESVQHIFSDREEDETGGGGVREIGQEDDRAIEREELRGEREALITMLTIGRDEIEIVRIEDEILEIEVDVSDERGEQQEGEMLVGEIISQIIDEKI